jgi:hypothetical protein
MLRPVPRNRVDPDKVFKDICTEEGKKGRKKMMGLKKGRKEGGGRRTE